MRNNRGSLLIFSFWALIVLILMSLGIVRRLNAELALTHYQTGKVRARYAAFAGLFYAMDRIREKQSGPSAGEADTAFACGIVLSEGQTARDLFSAHDLDGAVFSIVDEQGERFGLEDETGKININALTEQNSDMFQILLQDCGVALDDARTITASVIDWMDSGHSVFREPYGAEQEYYQSLDVPYDCKNRPFETVEELLLVRGMNWEILQKIRPYITIYPASGPLKVNFNTAPAPVLLALAQASIGAKTNTGTHDAEDFVRFVVEFRNGSDGIWGTPDDREVVLGRMPLGGGPRLAIASALVPFQARRAEFVRARVAGRDEASGIQTVLNAVIEIRRLSVVALTVQ